MSESPSNVWRKPVHLWVAAAITLLLALQHLAAGLDTSGLYRDEANGVALASQPGWSDIWQLMEFDAFGVVWFAQLRAWCALFGSVDDAPLRMLGCLNALAVIAAMWFAARKTALRVPVMALALAAVHPAVFRWSTTLRGYGLGAALMVLVYVAVWMVVCDARPRRVVFMALAALAAVHTVFYNAMLYAAVGLAGMVVCIRRRQWRRAGAIGAVGAGAALTMLPYVALARRRTVWDDVMFADVDIGQVVDAGIFTLDLAHRGFAFGWIAIVVLVAVASMWPGRGDDDSGRRDLSIYAGVSLILGVVLVGLFFSVLDYPVWAAYFMIAIVFVAICMDSLTARWRAARWAPVAAAALLLLASVLCASSTRRFARSRLTNIDMLARGLTELVTADDLIVVHHWSTGVSFARYYRGAAPWQTVPPLADHRVHRYDQVKAAMQQSDPLAPLLARVGRVLQSGGRVWVVRRDMMTRYSEPPPVLAPAGAHGQRMYPYLHNWQARLDDMLLRRARSLRRLDSPHGRPVVRLELLHVAMAEGFKAPPPAPGP